MVCDYVDRDCDHERCGWLDADTKLINCRVSVHCWKDARRVVRMIYLKTIRGYKATPHKIVKNIDGEWYESRPTKEIWSKDVSWPDVNADYWNSYYCAYRWFPVGKDYPKGEWYEIEPNLYGWEIDLIPGQKPLSAYYWHYGHSHPTFHEYKHVDGNLKHIKSTYEEWPF